MKKQQRMENKKRKTAALLNIMKSNEKDDKNINKMEEQPMENNAEIEKIQETDLVKRLRSL